MRTLSVLAGLVLAAATGAGLWIDIGNNWAYGLSVSHEAAIVLAAAAIGVAAFPAVAAVRGWSWLLGVGTVVCVTLTIGAAFLAYTAKQGATADTRRGQAAAYSSAQQDEHEARAQQTAALAEAAAIAETGGVAELGLMVDAAAKRAGEQNGIAKARGVLCAQVTRCRQAEETWTAAAQRLGQAKARVAALARAEEARKRIEQAQGRAKSGPASAPLSATWIAAQGGWHAETVDANVNVGLAMLMIAFTQILAWCAHPAVKCFAWGVERPAEPVVEAVADSEAADQVVNQAVEEEAAEEQAKPATRSRKRATRTAPSADVERVQAWAADALMARSGAAAAATDVFAAYQGQADATISQAAFGAAMAEAGFKKAKRGGRVVYTGVAFRQALRLAATG